MVDGPDIRRDGWSSSCCCLHQHSSLGKRARIRRPSVFESVILLPWLVQNKSRYHAAHAPASTVDIFHSLRKDLVSRPAINRTSSSPPTIAAGVAIKCQRSHYCTEHQTLLCMLSFRLTSCMKLDDCDAPDRRTCKSM